MKKLFYPFILLFVIGLYTGCDVTSQAPNNKQLSTQFIIFADSGATDVHIASLISAKILQESQINYRYKNKINGFSADLSQKQLNRINSKKYVISTDIIPGIFIIVFKDPFNGKKYVTDEGNAWSMKTIKKMQAKYNISDAQVLSRYGYAIFGFAAKLKDKQLYELDHEKLVKNIGSDLLYHLDTLAPAVLDSGNLK
jgi:hypothetical protein